MRLIRVKIIILFLSTTLMLGQQNRPSPAASLTTGQCVRAQLGKNRFRFELMLPQPAGNEPPAANCPTDENASADWPRSGSFFSFAAF